MTHPESPPPVVLTQKVVRKMYGVLVDDGFNTAFVDPVKALADAETTCIPTADLSTLREKAAAFNALGQQYNALEARYNESSRENDRLRQALEAVKLKFDDESAEEMKASAMYQIADEALRAQEPNNV